MRLAEKIGSLLKLDQQRCARLRYGVQRQLTWSSTEMKWELLLQTYSTQKRRREGELKIAGLGRRIPMFIQAVVPRIPVGPVLYPYIQTVR